MKQPAEKRKNVRRSVTYPAFIDLGDGAPRECLLCDASQHGALLSIANPRTLPAEFTLALSADGAARRHCRVMWRTKTQIGVAFLKGPSKTPSQTAATPAPPTLRAAATPKSPEAPAVRADIETLTPR